MLIRQAVLVALTLLMAARSVAVAADPAVVEASPVPPIPRLDPVERPSREAVEESIRRGLDFLIEDQNSDGSWGSATRTKQLNIYAPIPGSHLAFRAAVTAMAVSALSESGDSRTEVRESLHQAEEWLLEHLGRVRRATPDALYNVWTHCYAIQALVHMHAAAADDEPRRAKIAELIELQFDLLGRYESVDGGWGYYDFDVGAKQPAGSSISFVNAAVLVAFHEAQQAGFQPPQRLVDRAVAATKRQRLPDFSYLYGEYLKWQPRRGINRPGGSLGRSQACNAALRLWGDETVTDAVLAAWLDRLFARNGWLDIGRKRPIPHEAWFQVAGYFYFFGHFYGSHCILLLPEDERPQYQAHMEKLILSKQEQDGSWWDFPLYDYHQPYGTSFALMTLFRCRQ